MVWGELGTTYSKGPWGLWVVDESWYPIDDACGHYWYSLFYSFYVIYGFFFSVLVFDRLLGRLMAECPKMTTSLEYCTYVQDMGKVTVALLQSSLCHQQYLQSAIKELHQRTGYLPPLASPLLLSSSASSSESVLSVLEKEIILGPLEPTPLWTTLVSQPLSSLVVSCHFFCYSLLFLISFYYSDHHPHCLHVLNYI